MGVRPGPPVLPSQFFFRLNSGARSRSAASARDLLPALTDTLRAARQHLQIVREIKGIDS
jgi:hypothetical protein